MEALNFLNSQIDKISQELDFSQNNYINKIDSIYESVNSNKIQVFSELEQTVDRIFRSKTGHVDVIIEILKFTLTFSLSLLLGITFFVNDIHKMYIAGSWLIFLIFLLWYFLSKRKKYIESEVSLRMKINGYKSKIIFDSNDKNLNKVKKLISNHTDFLNKKRDELKILTRQLEKFNHSSNRRGDKNTS